MSFPLCKKKYIRISNKEQEERLDKLIDFLDETGCGFYSMAERGEGDHKFVQVIVDIKVSANNSGKKLDHQ